MSSSHGDKDEGTLLRGGGLSATKDDATMMSKRTLQWTSVRAPATSLGDNLQSALQQYGAVVSKGIRVSKVTTRGVLKKRVITVSQDKYSVFVTHQSINKKMGGKKVYSTVASKLPLPVISRKGIVGFSNEQDLRDRYVRYIDVADIDFVDYGVVASQKLESSRSGNRLKGAESWVDQNREMIVTIGHHGTETLDVLVSNKEERDQLVQCLRTMRQVYLDQKPCISNEALLLRYVWYDVDKNQDGVIGEAEWLKILSRINFNVKNPAKCFQEFVQSKTAGGGDAEQTGDGKGEEEQPGLTYPDIMELLQDVKRRDHVSVADELWDQVFGAEETVVPATDFLEKFVRGVQGETDGTMDDVEKMFSTINAMEINCKKEPTNIVFNRQISRERFRALLHHEINSAYDPRSVHKDDGSKLNKPMSEYWINTSHNTYLTGDQLQSYSSVEMYMQALRRGCKCLELDCWDGEKPKKQGVNLAVVFHGHTITSKILFADIVRGVKSYMDQHPDTYPIILSLENHCSHPFQRQMADDMKTILGKLLYVPHATVGQGGTAELLPSPEELRGKVVIKGKRPPEPDDAAIDEGNEDDPYEIQQDNSSGAGATPDSSPAKAAGSAGKPDDKAKPKPPKIVPELAELTLFHGTKFKRFRESLTQPASHMHSISEPKITKILNKDASNATQWREYNVEHMTRTYPAGARVDSSNYNPVLAWSLGCQLVALNFQTNDTPMMLNDGLFRRVGGCGYVEKPASLLKLAAAASGPAKTRATTAAAGGGADAETIATEDLVGSDEETTDTGASNDKDDVMAQVGALAGKVKGGLAKAACSIPVVGNKKKKKDEADDAGPYDEDQPAEQEPPSPSALMAEHKKSFEEQLMKQVLPLRLKIRLLSGSCLPKPRGEKTGETIDPYVVFTVHDIVKEGGEKLSSTTSSQTSSTINDNGFCPCWNETKAMEFVVNSPEFAMVHLSLREKDIALDDKVADAVIPVSCLRKGYRSIQLYDRHSGTRSGAFGFATLLLEIRTFDLA